MFRIIRIQGSSMEPDYQDGDFVLIGLAKWFPAREKQIVIFYCLDIGLLIKKLISFCDEGFYVKGLNSHSLTSEQMGIIPYDNILGRVLFRFSFK